MSRSQSEKIRKAVRNETMTYADKKRTLELNKQTNKKFNVEEIKHLEICKEKYGIDFINDYEINKILFTKFYSVFPESTKTEKLFINYIENYKKLHKAFEKEGISKKDINDLINSSFDFNILEDNRIDNTIFLLKASAVNDIDQNKFMMNLKKNKGAINSLFTTTANLAFLEKLDLNKEVLEDHLEMLYKMPTSTYALVEYANDFNLNVENILFYKEMIKKVSTTKLKEKYSIDAEEQTKQAKAYCKKILNAYKNKNAKNKKKLVKEYE